MMSLGNLECETLTVDTLKTDRLNVNKLNDITASEIKCLEGIDGNVQKQLDDLSVDAKKLKSLWQ